MTKKYILKRTEESVPGATRYREHLNPAQWEVVSQADGYSLVLAGAGSGKTRTLIYRVLYLIERGVKPQEIFLATFTNKAAAEMRSRVELYLGKELRGLWCGTFHHIALRLLRMNAKRAGLSESFGILDDEDSRTLMRASFSVLPFKPAKMRFPQAGVVQSMISLAANVQKTIPKVLEEKYGYFSHFEEDILKVAAEYKRRKEASSNLDFDDILLTWLRLMREDQVFYQSISSQFRYCMVDEYQDINPLQNAAVELLAQKSGNLLVVGDDAQSIYSFRGAQVQNILEFPQRHDNVRIFKMETNYRSSPEILDLANNSISNNSRQFQKELLSIRDSAVRPQLIKVRDPRDQAAFVAQRVLELVDEGIEMRNIAVLFRARYQAADLEMELARRRMRYVLRGGVRFFEQAHIKDVVSYMKIIDNPRDSIAFSRVMQIYPGIGPQTAQKLHETYAKEAAGKDPREIFRSGTFGSSTQKRAKEGLKSFNKLMEALCDPEEFGRPDILIQKILDAGYARSLETRFENAPDRVEDLRELANFAHSYESANDFLTDIALRENFRGESFAGETQSEPDDFLILSTIHQAKGLEWKVVFVIGLAEGQFPHHRSSTDDDAMEEERRLFYVASTRSQDELYMVHPMTRYDREAGVVIARTSPFVAELPEHSYEIQEAVPEESIDRFDLDDDDDIIELD